MQPSARKILALALLAAIIASSSCGSSGTGETTSVSEGGSNAADTTEASFFPDVNYDGYEFRILNFDTYFTNYIALDFETQTGERLDDAVYARNRKVEEAMGFKLVEVESNYSQWNTDQIALMTKVTNSVLAGDDAYDAAMVQPYFMPAILTEGTLLDLKSIPELKTEEIWWDRALNDSFTINGKMFAATSALQFSALDSVWVLLFNQDKMEELNLELPYDLVREGKWTIDELYKYASSAANLNGDESFAYTAEGNAFYGIAGHTSIPGAMIYTSGHRFVEPSGDGFKINLIDDRFSGVLEKIAKVFETENGIMYVNNASDKPEGYLSMFRNGRTLFLTAGLSAVSEFRDMKDNYGLVPFPKYDEKQGEYYSQAGVSAQMLGIPVTQTDASRAGNIIEALTHESYLSTLPIYYGVRIEQKGLRNEDSIEMVEIVRDSYGLEFAQVLGVTSGYISSLTNMIQNGNSNAASTAESAKSAVEAQLAELTKAFE